MKYLIDTQEKTLTLENEDGPKILPLYSDEAFYLLSHEWLKLGWNQKYPYTFTWFGRPIIQLPEDLIRLQEVIFQLQPDVILETGIAHGGSLAFSASLCHLMGKGRVIGVDIEIRPHNREAIEKHPLFPYITLLEGDSTSLKMIQTVHSLIHPEEKVLAIFDSNHSKEHVLKELKGYHSLIKEGSYLIVTDGFMKDLTDTPRGKSEWRDDNPHLAVLEFLQDHPEFILEEPKWLFNESSLSQVVTHWPGAWLKKV